MLSIQPASHLLVEIVLSEHLEIQVHVLLAPLHAKLVLQLQYVLIAWMDIIILVIILALHALSNAKLALELTIVQFVQMDMLLLIKIKMG